MQNDSRSFRGRHITLAVLTTLVLVLVLAVSAGPAAATTFSGSVQKTTGGTPTALTVGDVNSDGRADVVTANFNGNSISVFLQDASGALANGITYNLYPTTKTPVTWPGFNWTTTHPSGVVIADFSGDGHNDVVVADQWNWSTFYFEQDNPTSMTDPLDNTPDFFQPRDDYPGYGMRQPPGLDPEEVSSGKSLKHKYAMAYRFHFPTITLDQPGDALWFTDRNGTILGYYSTPFSATDFYSPIMYVDPADIDGGMDVNFKISKDMTSTTSVWSVDTYRVWYDYRETHPFSMPYSVAAGDVAEQFTGTEFVAAVPFLKNYEVYDVSGGEIYKVSAPVDMRTNNVNALSYGVAVADLNYDFTDDF